MKKHGLSVHVSYPVLYTGTGLSDPLRGKDQTVASCCHKHHCHPLTAVHYSEMKEIEEHHFLAEKLVKGTDRKHVKGSDDTEGQILQLPFG